MRQFTTQTQAMRQPIAHANLESFVLSLALTFCLLLFLSHHTRNAQAQTIPPGYENRIDLPCSDTTTNRGTVRTCTGTAGNRYNAFDSGSINVDEFILTLKTGAGILSTGGDRTINIDSSASSINAGTIIIEAGAEIRGVNASGVSAIRLIYGGSRGSAKVMFDGDLFHDPFLYGVDVSVNASDSTADIDITAGKNARISNVDRGVSVTHQGLGDINIEYGGVIDAMEFGIYTSSTSANNTTITALGSSNIYAESNAIYAIAQQTGNMEVNILAGSRIESAGDFGMRIEADTGTASLNHSGIIAHHNGYSALSMVSGDLLKFTTNSGSLIVTSHPGFEGVDNENFAVAITSRPDAIEGDKVVTHGGAIMSIGGGISVEMLSGAGTGDARVTILESGFIDARINAIRVDNHATGNSDIIVDHAGEILAAEEEAVHLSTRSDFSGIVDFTTQAGSTIIGGGIGVSIDQLSLDNGVIIKHSGFLEARSGDGFHIKQLNSRSRANININLLETSAIEATEHAVRVEHYGLGDITVDIQSAVQTEQRGLHITINNELSRGDINITIRENGLIETIGTPDGGYFIPDIGVAYVILTRTSGKGNVSVVNHGAIRGPIYIRGDYEAGEGALFYPIFPFLAPQAVGGDISAGDMVGHSIITGDITGTTFVRFSLEFRANFSTITDTDNDIIIIDTELGKSTEESFILDPNSTTNLGKRNFVESGLFMYDLGFDEDNGYYLIRSEPGVTRHNIKTVSDIVHHTWQDVTTSWSEQLRSKGADREDIWITTSHNVSTRDMPTTIGTGDIAETLNLEYEQTNSFVLTGTKKSYKDSVHYGPMLGFSNTRIDFKSNEDVYYYRAVTVGAHVAYKKNGFFMHVLGKFDFGDTTNNKAEKKGFLGADMFSYGLQMDLGKSFKNNKFDLTGLVGGNFAFMNILDVKDALPDAQSVDFDDSNVGTAYIGVDLKILKPFKVRNYIVNARLSARTGITTLSENRTVIRVADDVVHLETDDLYGSDYSDVNIELSAENELSGTLFYARFGSKSSGDMSGTNIQLGIQREF